MRLVALAIVALLLASANARAERDPAVTICLYVVDRGAELARAGDMVKLKAMKPQLLKCRDILKADEMRGVGEYLKQTRRPKSDGNEPFGSGPSDR